jgi:hypothetical protein
MQIGALVSSGKDQFLRQVERVLSLGLLRKIHRSAACDNGLMLPRPVAFLLPGDRNDRIGGGRLAALPFQRPADRVVEFRRPDPRCSALIARHFWFTARKRRSIPASPLARSRKA